ncbi:MAG: tRNA pseudouridine(55) synthase TruB [bacterium]|nr:tRNA pseudouridine(55) synthase TruB [bacterium]
MDGFFLIDKPPGITSHDVVAAVRHRLESQVSKLKTRVGHAGTLDPLATGLLIVGVGTATKKLGTLLKLPKTYEAGLIFGATSTTDDAEGKIQATGSREQRTGTMHPTRQDIERALQQLTGEIEQVPPAYSAVKVRGVPAYRRARRGECVALPARPVTVFEAQLLSFSYPHARIRWTVSSGTYIRSLARDLGEILGTGAYLSALRRTAIGPLAVSAARALDTVTLENLQPLDNLLRGC